MQTPSRLLSKPQQIRGHELRFHDPRGSPLTLSVRDGSTYFKARTNGNRQLANTNPTATEIKNR